MNNVSHRQNIIATMFGKSRANGQRWRGALLGRSESKVYHLIKLYSMLIWLDLILLFTYYKINYYILVEFIFNTSILRMKIIKSWALSLS